MTVTTTVRSHEGVPSSPKTILWIATVILGLLMLSISARAFFMPLTTAQKIAASSVIAVVEITKVDFDKGQSEATVIFAVLGAKEGERIEIWDDWQIDKNGSESRIAGRDPDLETGKRYLIYLVKKTKDRLVTVQSSLDCLEVVGEKVKKEGGEDFEPLADKLTEIRTILAKQKQAEQEAAGEKR